LAFYFHISTDSSLLIGLETSVVITMLLLA